MNSQRGLSLVELMISITLGLVLMAGVIQMFLSSQNVFSGQQGLSRNQETGRLAVDFIARDTMSAAHYGCFRPTEALGKSGLLLNSGLSISGLHKSFGIGVSGYENSGKLPDGPAIDLGKSTVDAASSILILRGAGGVGAQIHSLSTATTVSGYTPNKLVDSCVGGLCKNIAMVASDCGKAVVFVATDVSLAGTEVTVTHAVIPDLNTLTFSQGQILPLNTTVYFVAPGANPSGANSLWQRVNTGDPVELLEGVQSMYITYGDNKNNYQTANSYTTSTWKNVVGVRIEILVRSLDDNVVPAPQPYFFATKTVTPTDRRLYQVFTATIDLRNRDVISN